MASEEDIRALHDNSWRRSAYTASSMICTQECSNEAADIYHQEESIVQPTLKAFRRGRDRSFWWHLELAGD